MLLESIALQKSKNPRVSEKSIFCAFSVHKKLQHFFETTIGYVYEISVFARGVNSTMKRARALQWPESVPAGNPYSRT